jgi:D-amino-acid dehydrogenase
MAKHILIIGAGVIGRCAAYYAARQGHRVTLVDRDSPDTESCSFGNAGMIVPSHFVPLAAPGMIGMGLKMIWNPKSPFRIKPTLCSDLLSWGWKFCRTANQDHVTRSAPLLRDLNMASRACYEQLADESNNDFGLVKKGLLMLCKSPKTLEHESHLAQTAHQLGVPAQILSPTELARLEPNVTMDVAGAVYFPNDCHLSPNLFLSTLLRKISSSCQFLSNTSVTGWKKTTAHISALITTEGEIPADEFVICGGAWSSGIARDLNLSLPMLAGKGYSLTLNHPRQLPAICSIFTEARVAVTPMLSTLRFGGTMELGVGLDTSINPLRVQGIIESVPNYFPEFTVADFADIKPWAGLRPCSPDGLPYIGRFNQYKNLSVATGHGMMGLSMGPITGKLIAQILSNEPPSINITALSPDRY